MPDNYRDCKRNMVQSGRNNSIAKTERQPQKTICSCSKRRSTRASLFSSVHGWCRIFTLLLFLALVMTGKAIESKVKALIPITSSALKLNRCFTDSQSVTYRKMAMNNGQGCQDGTFYLCGYDVTKTYIIECCQPEKECIPGTTHIFVVANSTFKLECHPCDTGWFEPEFSKSSRSSQLAGCSYQHKPHSNINRNLVLFENGTASHATRWYCDIRNGYYEENGNICDDVPTKPCNCIHKTCKHGYLLRLDGICVRCNTHLDPHNYFRCVQDNGDKLPLTASTSTGIPAKLQQSDDENPLQRNTASHTRVDSVFFTTSAMKKRITTGEASNEVEGILIVVVITVVLLTPLGILCVCVCFCGSRKDEKGDNFKHLMFKDDESFADFIPPKHSFKDAGLTKVQINATGSKNVHIGDQHTHLNYIESTDNSKAVHNGDIINKTTFKDCIINFGQTERKISPTRNDEPRNKKPRREHPMTTLTSDGGNSLEMDHESDITEREMPVQRMDTLKFYSLDRGSIENDGLAESRQGPDGQSIDQTNLKQPFRET